MFEYRLQREDYWIKTLRSASSYGSNKKNKDLPVGKLFPPLPRYRESFIKTRTRPKLSNHDPLLNTKI